MSKSQLDPYIINIIDEVAKKLDLTLEEVKEIAVNAKARGKNPYAVLLGKLGGSKGGKKRAENLTGEQKREIAWMGGMTAKQNRGTIRKEDAETLKQLKKKYEKKDEHLKK